MNLKVELYMNGDQIDPANDRKLVTQFGIRDKTVREKTHFSILYMADVVRCACVGVCGSVAQWGDSANAV